MPIVCLARYVNGSNVELFESDIDNGPYIAISHVWGAASWRTLPGFPREVLISSQKEEFLLNTLPSLVGDSAFWMDVLCVDQRSKAARKAVAASIPAIYRQAERTIAVRDGDGFKQCCIDSIRAFGDWDEVLADLQKHTSDHFDHQDLVESYLNRLWTLQELIFSDVVQFANCGPWNANQPKLFPEDFYYQSTDFSRLIDSIHTLGHTWFLYGQDEAEKITLLDFGRAFLTCSTIRREQRLEPHETIGLPGNNFVELFSNSCRTATVPADYVLAIFPQFSWYTVPENVKEMEFAELFSDCHRQAEASGHGFHAKITQSMTSKNPDADPWKPSLDLPSPSSLGDFLKLMGSTTVPNNISNGIFTNGVRVVDAIATLDLAAALERIEFTMRFTSETWILAHRGGDVGRFGSWPVEDEPGTRGLRQLDQDTSRSRDSLREWYSEWHKDTLSSRLDDDWIVNECTKVLDLMLCGLEIGTKGELTGSWSSYKTWLLESNPPLYKENLVLLAAMVSCQVPLSAINWAKRIFRPVLIKFPKVSVLGLLSKFHDRAIRPAASFRYVEKAIPGWPGMRNFVLFSSRCSPFLCVERVRKFRCPAGQNLVLVDPISRVAVGLVPDFLYHLDEDEKWISRLQLLFRYAKHVGGDRMEISALPIENLGWDEEGHIFDMTQKVE